MTLKEYRSNPALVEYAAGLLASKKFRELLETIRAEHPKNYRILARGQPESDHALFLGRILGFDEFDNNLMAAAVPEAPASEPIQATFAPEPVTEQTGE